MSNENRSFGVNAIEVEDVIEINETQVKAPEPKIGVVVDCARLNVRRKPYVNANIVGVVEADDELEINVGDISPDGWYEVKTLGDKRMFGYCMAKYIEIKD